MKKIIIRLFMLGALAALLPAGAAAQQSDARQRTTETIVADGLAQLPAADAKVFNQVMGELAATGSKGVEMIAAMLVPADKGKNATFEYALNGVVAYVTDPAHEALRDDVRKGPAGSYRPLRRRRQPGFPFLAAAILFDGRRCRRHGPLSGRPLPGRLCPPGAGLDPGYGSTAARRGRQGRPYRCPQTSARLCFR